MDKPGKSWMASSFNPVMIDSRLSGYSTARLEHTVCLPYDTTHWLNKAQDREKRDATQPTEKALPSTYGTAKSFLPTRPLLAGAKPLLLLGERHNGLLYGVGRLPEIYINRPNVPPIDKSSS